MSRTTATIFIGGACTHSGEQPSRLPRCSTRQAGKYALVRQARTNTPLQSLVLMNETTYVECSRVMAERPLCDPKFSTDAQRVAYAFRLCTSRRPSDGEMNVLLESLARLRKEFDADKDDAAKLLGIGEKPKHDKLNPATVAAYSQVCDLILNLDETLTKE